MRRIIALVIALVAAAGGFYLGNEIWGAREFSVIWVNTVDQDGFVVAFRTAYALIAGTIVWPACIELALAKQIVCPLKVGGYAITVIVR